MATVLLAIGEASLREVCAAHLLAAGHSVLSVDRPLACLSLARLVVWDAACADDSSLGRDACHALRAASSSAPVFGIGLQGSAVAATVELPLTGEALLRLVRSLTEPPPGRLVAGALEVDLDRRLAQSSGREVSLTRTECRLLEVLFGRRPADVGLTILLTEVWGFSEGRGAAELVRAHIRNLRAKLASIGLPDVVRSRRGRGYSLVI